VDTELTVMR